MTKGPSRDRTTRTRILSIPLVSVCVCDKKNIKILVFLFDGRGGEGGGWREVVEVKINSFIATRRIFPEWRNERLSWQSKNFGAPNEAN